MRIDARTNNPSTNWDVVRNRYFQMNQSGEPNYRSRMLPSGEKSHAISRNATVLQQKIFELVHRLFFSPGSAVWIDNALLRDIPLSLIDDRPSVLQGAEEPSSSSAQVYGRLEARLHAAFEMEALEDGMNHPAEEIIAEALQSTDRQHVFEWFKKLSLDAAHPSFAASVLRCLGRQDRPGTVAWRVGVVRAALAMDNVEMRDAAAQAAESWGGPEMCDVLRAHTEPEPWLGDYIRDVIDDLAE